MSIIEWFVPKKRDFYQMLHNHMVKSAEAVRQLDEYFHVPNKENSDLVIALEKEADDVRMHLVAELNESFVTPIDREDIFRLSRAVDDLADYAKKIVKEMLIYKLPPNEDMRKMGEALLKAADELQRAVDNLDKDLRVASQHATNVKRLENHIDYLYHEALEKLFQTKDAVQILKVREIYRHLSMAADRCDDAADIVHDITMKMT